MRGLLLLIACAISACDPLWELNIEVRGDAAAQAAAGALPQVVLFTIDDSRGPGAYVAAVICQTSESFGAATKLQAIGCGKAGVLTAWLESKPTDVDVPCGSLEFARFVGARTPRAGAWRASIPVFQDGRCPTHDRVALTLGPP